MEYTTSDIHQQAYNRACAKARFRLHRHQPQDLQTTMRILAQNTQALDEADYYGQGALINDFEQQVAGLLGKPAGVFMPSGTLAQPLALRIWADKAGYSTVALHPTSHLVLHEQDGYQKLWNLSGKLWGDEDDIPTLEALQALHQTQPLAAVLIELPMRELGGVLPSWQSLNDLTHWARAQGIKTHLDGARLWQCSAAYHKNLAEIAALFDSVYVSFYKDLGGLAGAMLLGDTDFTQQARSWQRRAGGNLHTQAPFVLAARLGMQTHLLQMAERHQQALWLAGQLNTLPGVSTLPTVPHTSMFRLQINIKPEHFFKRACQWVNEQGVALIPPPYSVSQQHLRAEISIGDAFSALTRDTWAAHLNAFSKAVLE
ncbi:beta-eliminating lyase-related protein [Lacimicrobium sp. SS2-24]|uniref:threonine aldolase family protein n=1 Tax=Lacimicrobium sp. SS2-24 TaxID=2005569 RepID=UPI000B4BE0BA|nr:beta-eliminating lyase-related protein [Lacimicrobium sp. SS2-24]